jgi:hypothetical protein
MRLCPVPVYANGNAALGLFSAYMCFSCRIIERCKELHGLDKHIYQILPHRVRESVMRSNVRVKESNVGEDGGILVYARCNITSMPDVPCWVFPRRV